MESVFDKNDIISVRDGLWLSAYREGDEEALIHYLNEETISRNTLKIPYPYTMADATEWLEMVEKLEHKYHCRGNWAIRHGEGELIGAIGRHFVTGVNGHRDEIGYWLGQPWRNRGWMTAVVRRLVEYLFDTTPLIRIEAYLYVFNTASARVLEKAGFAREGLLRKYYLKEGQYLDGLVYARIKNMEPQ